MNIFWITLFHSDSSITARAHPYPVNFIQHIYSHDGVIRANLLSECLEEIGRRQILSMQREWRTLHSGKVQTVSFPSEGNDHAELSINNL